MKKILLLLAALMLALGFVWLGCETGPSDVTGPDEETVVAGKGIPDKALARIMSIQDRHTPKLLENPGIVGTASGLGPDGNPAVLVLTKHQDVKGIPDSLDGAPVVVEVTGEILALARPVKVPTAKIDPTARFTRPVPIGVSTGNVGECSSGTIACRVKDGANVYALSNNHVYALGNRASIGSKVVQPGLYDTGCSLHIDDFIGSLSKFEALKFDGSSNRIDAAVALTSTANLSRATPANGYGTPKSQTVTATVGMAVQKYGRSSALTKGIVTGINASVRVTYSEGTALFTGQIIVESGKPVIKPGDSGSLLVTNPGKSPVGLLYAGTSSGKLAVANDIGEVLSAMGVSIDGE